MPHGVRALVGSCFALSLLLTSVAAAVTLPAGTVIRTQYGSISPRETREYDSYSSHPNGTIFFDLTRGYVNVASEMVFDLKSYGNGTLTIRFKGPEPLDFETHTPVVPQYDRAKGWLEFVFTTEETSFLAIDYPRPSPAWLGVNPIIIGAGIVLGLIVMVTVIAYRRMSQRRTSPVRTPS